MSKVRLEHVGKGQRDREQYVQNTVRRQIDSTLEEEPLVDFDSTETVPAKTTTAPRIRSTKRAPSFSFDRVFVKVLEGLAAVGIIGALIWGAVTLFGLNRELGEIKSKMDRMERLEQKMDDLDKRLQDEIKDRLTASQPPSRPANRR